MCFLGSLCLATITAQVGFAIGTSVMHFHAVVNATGYQTTAQKTSVIQNEKGVGGGGEREEEKINKEIILFHLHNSFASVSQQQQQRCTTAGSLALISFSTYPHNARRQPDIYAIMLGVVRVVVSISA